MPIPSTRQTYMDTFMGMMPGVNAYGQVADMAFRVKTSAKTADYQVLASETGTYFTDRGTTGTMEFTLPSVQDGLCYHFYSVAAGTMKIIGDTNLMVADNDATATSVQLAGGSAIIGGGFFCYSNGTKWFAMPFGTEGATVTIA